jgi:hypothetical protein
MITTTATAEQLLQCYDVLAAHLDTEIRKGETLALSLDAALKEHEAMALLIAGAQKENAATLDDLRAVRDEVKALARTMIASTDDGTTPIDAFIRREGTPRLHQYAQVA